MRILVFVLMMISSMSLAIMPAIAADYTLGIFGNANMDGTIDEDDIDYVMGIIKGANEETELADANYDGRIDEDDIAQIELIISGGEKELTYVDICGEAETVHKPITSIVDYSAGFATEVMRALDAEDMIVAVSKNIADESYGVFPELSKLPVVAGSSFSPDYEAILNQHPDALITYIPWANSWALSKTEWEEKLPGVQIISLGFINPIGEKWTGADGVGEYAGLIENTKKLAYILDKEDEAEEFCDWYEGWLNLVKERTDGLSEDEKPRVYTEWNQDYRFLKGRHHQICTLAGGKDLLEDLPTNNGYVDPEWVMENNPEIIVLARSTGFNGGYGTADFSVMKAVRDSVLNRPEVANVSAVVNDRVYVEDAALTNGPRTIVAIVYHAKWYHPELFNDMDPRAIHQEYLARFQGLDLDLDERGVFVYPEVT